MERERQRGTEREGWGGGDHTKDTRRIQVVVVGVAGRVSLG